MNVAQHLQHLQLKHIIYYILDVKGNKGVYKQLTKLHVIYHVILKQSLNVLCTREKNESSK